MAKRLQIRRDTSENWAFNNPILSLGEMGYATDTQLLKIGDGTTAWNLLQYFIPQDTDELLEGTTNLYFTDERAILSASATIDSASAQMMTDITAYVDNLTTDDIEEGNNLYFTNQRTLDATAAVISSASALAVTNSNSYTDSSLQSLIDTAPEALNTLNELAAAMNDDPDFYNTIQALLDQKLNISTASATYLSITDAQGGYDTLGSADAAQSAATGYTSDEINALDTDDIEEGSTNLYFTDNRALASASPTILSASTAVVNYSDSLTTDDIDEASNLYFTDARAISATISNITSASANAETVSNSYTDSSVANLIDSAPDNLNTLSEIASAINNDPNYYQTVDGLLADKLGVSDASATYLSIIDAEDNYITGLTASTLFVTQGDFDAAVAVAADSISASPLEINEQSSNYTLQVSDFRKTIEMNSAGSLIITIDNDSAFPVGFYFNLTQTGEGSVTVQGGSGVSINSANNQYEIFQRYTSAYIYKRDANMWIMIIGGGNLVLRSPNKTLYEITIADDGSLITTAI